MHRSNVTLYNLACCLFLVLLFSTTGGCGTRDGNGSGAITPGVAAKAVDTLYYLDLSKPTIEQPVDFTVTGSRPPKFVRIEVARVTNPGKLSLSFDVWYESKDRTKVFLGSFSLYPSDNPGEFVVPTQGKLNEPGVIRVSLVTPDKNEMRDSVRVALKRITFL